MMLWELMWGHRRPRRRGACPYTPGPTSYLWQSVAESNARWLLRPRSEVELFLKTVIRFVASQTQPLQKQIAELKARIEELQARKFCGVHQRALGYKSGAQATFDNGLWIAITDVEAGEIPGQSSKWQLAFRHIDPPRQPTRGGACPSQPEHRP